MNTQPCCAVRVQDTHTVGTSATRCCGSGGSRRLPEESQAIKELVREKYSQIALGERSCGVSMMDDSYQRVDGYVGEADLGLGCGLPVDHAGLIPGHSVLDLGSGAGLDVFVARRVVGDEGMVTGLDFSEAMVHRARQNARSLGYSNVRFALGDIEQMPFDGESFDVVISNCVLNLVPDKRAAFSEVHRVLRRGGHFAVSDVVLSNTLQLAERQDAASYIGCVAGAMERDAYLRVILAAGFTDVTVVNERQVMEVPGAWSVTVCGAKP